MQHYKPLEKFSIGVGDRFAHQAKAQLKACQLLDSDGVAVVPVWNKSNREHTFIGSEPSSVREAAAQAVEALEWKGGWHVDADHIGLKTVDRFLSCSDFFTLDVADAIGQPAAPEEVAAFIDRHPELVGTITLPKTEIPLQTTVSYTHLRLGLQTFSAPFRICSLRKWSVRSPASGRWGADSVE